MKKYAVGVDVGGTTVKMGMFTVEGELLCKWEIPTRTEDGGKYILSDITKSLEEKRISQGISTEEICGIGIGVPGPVNRDGNVEVCVNLGWGFVEIEKELEALTGYPVKAGNDANVAAMGEVWQGAAKGARDAVMVTLGTGVGGGIILGGRILAGVKGFAGEIGHFNVNPHESESCNCGNKGCLEQYASATGIVRMTKKYLKEHDVESSLRKYENITAKDIFDEAKNGDETAMYNVKQLCKILASVLGKIALTVDPEVYIIGGGVSKAGTILTDGIAEEFPNHVFGAAKENRFVLAELGNDAGIYGAAKLVV
ncbi:MAG: ROK family glucokinase [Lachnospiraceae bacterium]|nr:ROK family glucokinase [Lachnospiraceae bacterium]